MRTVAAGFLPAGWVEQTMYGTRKLAWQWRFEIVGGSFSNPEFGLKISHTSVFLFVSFKLLLVPHVSVGILTINVSSCDSEHTTSNNDRIGSFFCYI